MTSNPASGGCTHLAETFPYPFRITVADNASTDRTPWIAARLAGELPGIQWVRLEEKGRGRALHTAWSRSPAAVLAYLDVDLSTDLAALLPLVAPLISGHSDLAIGTRLARGSRVVRGPKREIISRCYNGLLRGTLSVGFTDAQCGFKAVRREVAERLLPLVEDREWFFDTELLVIAERAGLRIHEVPVDWVDDPDSRVDLLPTALADLRGMARLGRALARGRLPLAALGRARTEAASVAVPPPGGLAQLLRFAAVGAAGTLLHLALYVLLRPAAGAQSGNALALLLCTVLNTAANRRFTFGVRGRAGLPAHHLGGLVALLAGLALTSERWPSSITPSPAPVPARNCRCWSARTSPPPCSASASCAPGSSPAVRQRPPPHEQRDDPPPRTDGPRTALAQPS